MLTEGIGQGPEWLDTAWGEPVCLTGPNALPEEPDSDADPEAADLFYREQLAAAWQRSLHRPIGEDPRPLGSNPGGGR